MLNHLKKIYLPYTAIDVGWWMQLFLPRLPSGRGHYIVDMSVIPQELLEVIANEGDVPTAVTDLRDIGVATARIIADLRTLNRLVFAYGETSSQREAFEVLERVSGEEIGRRVVSLFPCFELVAVRVVFGVW